MGTFFVFIIKSAICLIIFYLFYKLLLSKDTFHRFNRIALLSLLLLSFVVPLGRISLSPSSEVDQAVVALKDFVMQAEPATISQTAGSETATKTSHLWILVLICTYLAGMAFFVLRQTWSLFMMFRLMKRSRTEKMENDVTILVHGEKISPFSWMNYIFISEKDLEENGNEILTHELAHIHKKHSWDLILADICIFFQWFNPATWLLKQELQSIHEFEADDVVLNQGIDAKQYQLLLIKKAVGTRLYTMANSFNHSSLKKRITMMLKEKSNPWARLKYLYILPLACITMLAFARPDVSRMEKISAEKVNDLIASPQPEKTTPEIPSVDKINKISGNSNSADVKKVEDRQHSGTGELLAQNATPTQPPPPIKTSIQATTPAKTPYIVSGKVISKNDNQPLSSVSVTEVGSTGRAIGATITKEDGTFEFLVKNSDNKLKFSHVGYLTTESPVKEINNIQMEEKTLDIEETVVVGDGASTDKMEDIASNQEQKYVLVEQMPQFPGGKDALMKYILGSVKYPRDAMVNKIAGKVVCSCVVNAVGRVTDVKVISSINPDLDKEAKRVVENMPDWIPGKQNGKNVPMKLTIPINFRIAK